MYVTDLNHFEGIDTAPNIPPQALRFAEYLRRAISAATAHQGPGPNQTALPCRRRPGHRPCPGRLAVRRQDLPEEIEWGCPSCGEGGTITNWRGSPYDLTGSRAADDDGPSVSVVVPGAAYRFLLDGMLFDEDCQRVLFTARPHEHGAELVASEDDIEELAGYVAFESNHAENRALQRRWDNIFVLLNDALK